MGAKQTKPSPNVGRRSQDDDAAASLHPVPVRQTTLTEDTPTETPSAALATATPVPVAHPAASASAPTTEASDWHLNMRVTAVAGAAGHAFAVWMPLDAFGPVAFATAAVAAGRHVVPSIVCGALTSRFNDADEWRPSTPELYAVTASLLRKTFITGDFGVAGLYAVSLPSAKVRPEKHIIACLQSLSRTESSLLEFEADYLIDEGAAGEALLAATCDVVRRHRHTLRRLDVPARPRHGQDGELVFAGALADALAECTAITSLDICGTIFPFRSWQQLGPTLHTLKLTELDDDGTNTTCRLFRLLADNMPALRDLDFSDLLYCFEQDGFIELVSRLRSLSLTQGCPWAAVRNLAAWPLTLPNLEELVYWTYDGGEREAVAVEILRRAVSLRAADVSHVSALAAIAAGPVAGLGGEDAAALPSSLRMHAPLSNVRRLALNVRDDDAARLDTTLSASPRATVVRLRTSLRQTRDFFHAAASAASGEGGAGWCSVRRVRLDLNFSNIASDPNEAARRVRAVFPRARYASWWANGVPDVQLPPPSL